MKDKRLEKKRLMEFIEQIQIGFCGLFITLLFLALYIIIASAILKCFNFVKGIKIWERIAEILKTLTSHTESLSSNLCSSQTQEQTPSRTRNINPENIEEIVTRTRNNINIANNEIIRSESTNLEMAPPPSYEESVKENCPVHMNSCSSLPTYEESLTIV